MIIKTVIYIIFFIFYPFFVQADNIEGKGLICSKFKSSLKHYENEHIGYWFTKINVTNYSLDGYKVKKMYKVRYETLTRYIEWEHDSCKNQVCLLNRETLKISDYKCSIIKARNDIINKLENYVKEQKIKNKI